MHQFSSKIWDVSCQNSYHIIQPSFEDRHSFSCVGICCNSIQLIPVHMQIYSDNKNEYNNRNRLCLYMYYCSSLVAFAWKWRIPCMESLLVRKLCNQNKTIFVFSSSWNSMLQSISSLARSTCWRLIRCGKSYLSLNCWRLIRHDKSTDREWR